MNENTKYEYYVELVKKLEEKKLQLGYTNVDIARLTKISERTVGGLFNGSKDDIRFSNLMSIAIALGYKIELSLNEN